MTATMADPATDGHVRESSLRALAWRETVRLARQPLFALATLAFLWFAASAPFTGYADADYPASGMPQTNLDWPLTPAFFLGLGGLLAANRLVTSTRRAGEVLGAAPVSEPRRTLALCLACLLPAAIALAGSAYVFAFWMVNPPVNSVSWGELSTAELVAVQAAGVLAALGGPLLGVLVGRWWRWPTAAAVTSVVLVVWAIGSIAPLDDSNPLLRLLHHSTPFTLIASVTETSAWHFGGSLAWRVVYLAGLCALGVLVACAHGMDAPARRRLAPWVVGTLAVTLAALGLAAFAGDPGHYAPWRPEWTAYLQ
jgi:hypothetical protein